MNKILLVLSHIMLISAAYLRKNSFVQNDYIPINENDSFFISYKNNSRSDVLNNENFDIVYKKN